ncbi:hypothetical protein WR25_14353 [Diploscapter pachys]|uniref:Uncharacterized protein n=1 Tax=Diploscapter pachys TaxID=2018661 RepID=A0A2A2J300_9BILA|nr:hypothetical protein WR25_14353 [Diploscapter pachys]
MLRYSSDLRRPHIPPPNPSHSPLLLPLRPASKQPVFDFCNSLPVIKLEHSFWSINSSNEFLRNFPVKYDIPGPEYEIVEKSLSDSQCAVDGYEIPTRRLKTMMHSSERRFTMSVDSQIFQRF